MRLRQLLVLGLASIVACDATAVSAPANQNVPTNLSYQLIPSGDPSTPLGVLLTWQAPANGRANTFDVYGRTGNAGWLLRATTTSPSFHDAGSPQDQYYVVAVDAQG